MCFWHRLSFLNFHFWIFNYNNNLKFKLTIINIESDKEKIAKLSIIKQEENDAFRVFLKNRNAEKIDQLVFQINHEVEQIIDCTACGACCRGLMINVTQSESDAVAAHLEMNNYDFEEKYIEKSLGGQMIMNTIPCHFLSESKCTIYEKRFNECREFPHLHKPNFTDRLFGTLIHYSICPIIFNVVEELKTATQFFKDNTNK